MSVECFEAGSDDVLGMLNEDVLAMLEKEGQTPYAPADNRRKEDDDTRKKPQCFNVLVKIDATVGVNDDALQKKYDVRMK